MKRVRKKSLFAKSMLSFYHEYLECHKRAKNDIQTKFYIQNFGLSKKILSDNENKELKAFIFFVFLKLEYIDYSIDKVEKCIVLDQYEKAYKKGIRLFRELKLIIKALGKIDEIIKTKTRGFPEFNWFDVDRFEILTTVNLQKILQNNQDSLCKELVIKDLDLIRSKMNLYKFMVPLYLMMTSSFYSQKTNHYARKTLGVFRTMLQDSSLQCITLQTKNLTGAKSKRNSYNGTTRILGVFTRENEDIYLFRLDFPHTNEESIHINVHESKKGNMVAAGYPLKKTDIQKFSLTQQQIDELFVDDGKYYWFKLRNSQKISELRKPQQTKDDLMTLFRVQSHYIVEKSCKEQEYFRFIKEYKKVLELMGLPFVKSESFDKEDDKYLEVIKQIRKSLIAKNFYSACLLNRMGVCVSKISALTNLSEKVVIDLLDKTKGRY